MTTTQEALKLCLRVLRPIAGDRVYETRWLGDAISAAEEALEQQEQKPLYFGLTHEHTWLSISKTAYDVLEPKQRMALYTHPTKQLSDDEIKQVVTTNAGSQALFYMLKDDVIGSDFRKCIESFARAIEAKVRGE